MRVDKFTVGDLLRAVIELPERHNCSLYKLPGNLNQENTVLLVEDDEYDAPDEIEEYVSSLSWADIKDIIDNLQSQNPNPTIDDYIEAINYYIENDAFIDVEDSTNKPKGGFKIWG